MIVIAEPYARYTQTLSDSELESAAARLLQLADDACRDYFAQRYEQLGITAVARVEIGSTKTWTTIKAVTTALVLYGSLRACLKTCHASQTTHHQMDHGHADHRFAGVGQIFVIFG